MLLILYGAASFVGYESRNYICNKGFELIEKCCYYETVPSLKTRYGTRKIVTKEEFINTTDAAFRYEVGGIQISFNQSQIDAAISDEKNYLLTLSSPIGVLSSLKDVYGDEIKIVYCYISDCQLGEMFTKMSDISEAELTTRLETGRMVKNVYANHSNIFDHVVLYCGEDSQLNMQSLKTQYDSILDIAAKHEASDDRSSTCDVVLLYANKDFKIAREVYDSLCNVGVKVFDYCNLKAGEDWLDTISSVILGASVVIVFVSQSLIDSKPARVELEAAISAAHNYGTTIIPVFVDDIGLKRLEESISNCEVISSLEFRPCVILEKENREVSLKSIQEKVVLILQGERRLKELAETIDSLLMFNKNTEAIRCLEEQESICIELCKLFGESDDTDRIISILLRVYARLANLHAQNRNYNKAIDYCAEGIELTSAFDVGGFPISSGLIERFVACAHELKMSQNDFLHLIGEKFASLEDDVIDEMISAFDSGYLDTTDDSPNTPNVISEDVRSTIAKYTQVSIDLFESLSKEGMTSEYGQLLKMGYERILDYCRVAGVNGEVIDKCLDRISAIKEDRIIDGCNDSEDNIKSLKVYLGESSADIDGYDVFICYKSEDETLAEKVYSSLRRMGKEVFFAKESLPKLGDSEYKDRIDEAIEKSKHMVIVSSNPDYLKTRWVMREWSLFDNEKVEGRKDGNIFMVLTEDIAKDKGRLPIRLRNNIQIFTMNSYSIELYKYLQ